MTLPIDSIVPEKVSGEGGVRIELVGTFAGYLDAPFRVHVGPNGDMSDPECLSGVPGQGNTLYPISGTRLRCYLPVLDPTYGAPYHVFVRILSNPETELLSDILEVLPPQYYSKVFELRAVLPPYYYKGPINMGLLEPTS